MENWQAIDSSSLAIQNPNGRLDRMHRPIGAAQVMKTNPGHCVALLLTTALYYDTNNSPLRITRIKLLKPSHTLILGHVYKLVSSKEVMAKKQAQMRIKTETVISSEFEQVFRKSHETAKMKQAKSERHISRNNAAVVSRSRVWQPSLKSISETGS